MNNQLKMLDKQSESPLEDIYKGGLDKNNADINLVDNINQIRNEVCDKGYICRVIEGFGVDRDTKRLCSEVQAQIFDAGYGHILNGTYCPGGSGVGFAYYWNCPAGYYCDDPAEDPKKCPKGYYCPVKTHNFDDFKCPECKEGAKRMPIRTGALIAMVIFTIVIPILVVVVYRFLRRKRNEYKKYAASNRLNKERVEEDLKRSKPFFTMIDNNLGGSFNLKLDKNGNLVDYDAEHLFDAIDENNDGVLSFDELQKALQLRGDKLQMFTRLMNEASGVPLASSVNVVSREVFTKSFFETITALANFEPTTQDTAELFDEIARDTLSKTKSMNRIFLSDLKFSRLSMFLSDKQILTLIRLFREKLIGGQNITTTNDEENFIDQEESILSKNKKTAPNMRMSLIKSIKRTGGSDDRLDTISRETFIVLYPSVLSELVGTKEKQLVPCDLQFEHLSLHVKVDKSEKVIVNNVTGRVQSGTMTALLGGSGAGKTSLLNALCGRAYYGRVSGKMFINGQEAEIDDCKDVMGFVPQDDIVFAELTVKENLKFAGKFRLPQGTSMEYISKLVADVIADLGLTRVTNSIVGDVVRRGISGGEKKRVNIGLELMGKPSILFLDEPTSGLDSSSAMVVMESLKRLVQNQGMTICTVIHQPRKTIFELFDSLILLGVGGNLVYHGPPKAAYGYFKKLNYELPKGESLADWLIDISSGELSPLSAPVNLRKSIVQEAPLLDTGEKRERLYKSWVSHFENLSDSERAKYDTPEKSDLPPYRKKQSFLVQTRYHIFRSFILFKRNSVSKLQEAFLIIGGTIVIVMIDKTLLLTDDYKPLIPYEFLVLQTAGVEGYEGYFEMALKAFFSHSMYATKAVMNFATKISVILSVLTALASTKALTEKRVEFFREASSGYNINAYYVAVNIFDTMEVTTKMIIAALFTATLRNTVASVGAMVVHFIMLGWISASWGLFFPLLIPPKSVILVTAFFMLFGALLLSGIPGMAIDYQKMQTSSTFNVVGRFLGCNTFFMESLVVDEFKTLPEQHGFTTLLKTKTPDAFYNGFKNQHFGFADPDVYKRSYNGWYWGVVPSLFVGLTIRSLGFILLHACNRSHRLKNPILQDLKDRNRMRIGTAVLFALFFGFAAVSIVTFRVREDQRKLKE